MPSSQASQNPLTAQRPLTTQTQALPDHSIAFGAPKDRRPRSEPCASLAFRERVAEALQLQVEGSRSFASGLQSNGMQVLVHATSTRTVFWPLFVQRSCGCGLGSSMLACGCCRSRAVPVTAKMKMMPTGQPSQTWLLSDRRLRHEAQEHENDV